MNNNQHELQRTQSVLASLRSLIPVRPLDAGEAMQIAELHAARLLELSDVNDWPVPSQIVTDLPRIQLQYRDLPTSGMSYWNGAAWVIALNRTEPVTRQRFTLLHEYKHVIDHGSTDRLYTGQGRHGADRQAELAATTSPPARSCRSASSRPPGAPGSSAQPCWPTSSTSRPAPWTSGCTSSAS